MRHMRWIIKIVWIALGVYWIPRFCHDQTDGFTVLRIQSKLNQSAKIQTLDPTVSAILSQDFTYLGSGGQAYAFVSADDRYVLKFFKHHRHSLPFWRKLLPGSHLKQEKRERKRLRDLTSYKLCMDVLPEEAGLLYLHLDETDHLKMKARIFDKLNIAHWIHLDTTAFILQRRATSSYDYLNNLIENGEMNKAKAALVSICDLIVSRCQKGIYDEDPRIHRNVGFVEGRAILIDVGRLRPDSRRLEPRIQRDDLKKITLRLKNHLEKQSPKLAVFLDDYIDKAV